MIDDDMTIEDLLNERYQLETAQAAALYDGNRERADELEIKIDELTAEIERKAAK